MAIWSCEERRPLCADVKMDPGDSITITLVHNIMIPVQKYGQWKEEIALVTEVYVYSSRNYSMPLVIP